MRKLFILALYACALASATDSSRKVPIGTNTDQNLGSDKAATQSRTLSKSLSFNEDLSTRIPLNNTRPSHILRFVAGSRQLHTALSNTKLSVVAVMSPHGAGEGDYFINKTATAARIIEQQYRYGKIKFILTDAHSHIGASQDTVFDTINLHLARKIKPSDFDFDALRNDHHTFQMDLISNPSSSGKRPFLDRISNQDFPAYVIAANGEPVEVWGGRSITPEDLAARVASIANGKLRVMSPLQAASYALRSPVNATVIVRHSCKTSQPLRIALAPFAQIIGGDDDLFESVPRGSFLVLTRNSTLSDVPLPHAAKLLELKDHFPTEAVVRLSEEGMVLVEVDSYEGGKNSYTHTKALRRHSRSLSKSKSMSKSISVEDGSSNSVPETTLTPPTINSDVSLGMEGLKIISRLVVPSINDFAHTTMQAVYARAPCIVIAFHGYGVFSYADLSSELKRQCTFLYSDGGEQQLIASFGFQLSEAGDEKQLLVGVHYDHGKYAMRVEMEAAAPKATVDAAEKNRRREEKRQRRERQERADAAQREYKAQEDTDSPYARPDDLDEDDDDVYESKSKKVGKTVAKKVDADADDDDDDLSEESEEAPSNGAPREPERPVYLVDRVAHRISPFVKSVLSGKATIYEKTQQFEGELTDPAAVYIGEFFNDFLDSDDIHSRMLSDYSRDSFIVVFPPACADNCENELRLMSTVVGNLDKYRDTDAFRSMAIAYYNLTSNDLHKHLEPSLKNATSAKLVFIERMKKFYFFMHNHARYARARFNGGLTFEGHTEAGVIDSETLDLKDASTADVYAFVRKHCQGSEYFLNGDGKDLETIEYDEL